MDSDLSYKTSAEIAQTMQSARLELAYERALREAERIYEEERVRVLRVQLLLLEDENADLHDQASQAEDEQIHMGELNEELQDHLSQAEADLQQSQMDLKARLRDLEYLRTEVDALHAASTDATKLLAEKLALTRELNSLKPELEHLKSQTSTQQKLLSEKLALQREVSTLQVELDTEKRAVQRIKTQEKSAAREDSAMTAEIEALKKDLLKQQREAQKTERENRKKSTDWENEKEMLEGKLDAFRNKLRSTKDQLQEAQDEIEKIQAAKMAQSAEMTKARLSGAAAGNPRKRSVARFDPDMTIGTPGHGGPAAKKPRISVNVGDKSNFSITPFLNRTLTILPESPAEDDEPMKKPVKKRAAQPDETGEDGVVVPKAKATKAKKEKAANVKPNPAVVTNSKTSQPLRESTNSKANATIKKQQLTKLVEEGSDLDSDGEEISAGTGHTAGNSSGDLTQNVGTSAENTTAPLKQKTEVVKRTTIFEEDDEPAPKVRDLGRGMPAGAGLGRFNLKARPAVGKGKTLAEFSPLKKDRKVVSVVG